MAAIIYLFLIQLQFPKSKSISNILCRRHGQNKLKRLQKFDKLNYCLHKAKLDLESLLQSRGNNAILVLNFRVSSHFF